MNVLSILGLTILFSTSIQAAPKKFMVCLGKEEQFIHENKIGGAYYKLNQQLISAFIQLPDGVHLNSQNFDIICNTKIKFPSIKLLELILQNKAQLFNIKISKEDVSEYKLAKISIKDIENASQDILLNFLTNLQSSSKNAKCLEQKIPELKTFYEQILYTEKEVGKKNIIKDLNDNSQVFTKLEKIAIELKNCK